MARRGSTTTQLKSSWGFRSERNARAHSTRAMFHRDVRLTVSGRIFFELPVFAPPKIDPTGSVGIPHLGLDEILVAILKDAL